MMVKDTLPLFPGLIRARFSTGALIIETLYGKGIPYTVVSQHSVVTSWYQVAVGFVSF